MIHKSHPKIMEEESLLYFLPEELKRIILSSLNAIDYMNLISTSKRIRKEIPITWHISYYQECRILSTIFHQRKNVFITGPGGCGKTYTLDRIKYWALKRRINFACLAPTGIAAYNIGGSTLHSFFPIDRKIYPSQKKNLRKKFQSLDLLIIDEISMVGCNLASAIDNILSEYIDCLDIFGGIQVVVSGDFFQLPPVKDKMLFGTDLWRDLRLRRYDFTVPMRQRNDLRFFNLLNRIRVGDITDSDIDLLKKRDIETIAEIPTERITHLYFRNVDVKEKNRKEFNKLPGQETTVRAIDETLKKCRNSKVEQWETDLSPNWESVYSKTATYTTKFSDTVSLKIGALYYITTNLDVKNGLVNGTLCTLKIINGDVLGIEYKGGFTWIKKIIKEFLFDNGEKKLKRIQFPLMLGYALTVHSSQGCTFDRIIFDLSKVTNRALLYVGLSRVKRIKDLFLIGVNEENIRKVLKK